MNKKENKHSQTSMEIEPGSFSYKYRYEVRESHYFHAHRGIEVLYIYDGHGEIMVDNQTYPIQDHTLVWFQPYQLHRVLVPPVPDRTYIRTNLTFDPSFLEPYLTGFPQYAKFFRNLWKGSLNKQVFYAMNQTAIPDVLRELHQNAADSAATKEEHTGFLMLQLIRVLQKQVSDEPAIDALNHSRGETHVERITDWLNDHYKQPFSLESLADHLHLSPYHISHLFKQFTGMTLSDYVIQRRVREACILLANTGKSVQEIAAEVGDLTPSYFSQMFKKSKGVTPEQYRRSIR